VSLSSMVNIVTVAADFCNFLFNSFTNVIFIHYCCQIF
jgi:hypothetical protein